MSLDRKIYENITHKVNTPIGEIFFSRKNVDFLQNEIVICVNKELKKKYGENTKMQITRQNDKEIMLLMTEIFNFFQRPVSILNNNKPPTIDNMAPVPASFLFSDIGDRYIPYEDHPNMKYTYDNYYAKKQMQTYCYPDHKHHYLQSFNEDITKQNIINNKYFDPKVPLITKVKFLNDMFLEHIIPKIIYEVHNYLKYYFQLADPTACILDNPVYVPKRNTKELSLQSYYSGTDEEYNIIHDEKNIKYPMYDRNFTNVKEFNQHTGKTLTADTLNPRIPMGEVDILFDSKKQENRFKERRKNSDLL